MKKSTLIIFCLYICQAGWSQSIDEEWNELLNTGDYLKMEKRYKTAKDSIQHPTLQVLTEALLYKGFNQPEKSCEKLGELLNFHQTSLGLGGVAVMIQHLALNMFNMGNYGEACSIIQSILDQTAAFNGLDEETRKSLENYLPLRIFGDQYAPVIIRPEHDCEVPIIPIQPELAHRISVPVILNGNTSLFILDTGADGYSTNTVTEGFARKHGIQIFEDSVMLSGVNIGYAKLGIADSIQIGEIIYKNVPFTIAPGDYLVSVDSLFMQAQATLGLVFLRAMGEMQIFPNQNKLVFPYIQTLDSGVEKNLMFYEGQPFIELYSENNRMLFHLDTGGGMHLSKNYYEKHKQEVETTGKLETERGIAGFGGKINFDQYILPEFPLTVSGITKPVKDMSVVTQDDYPPFVYGLAGGDFIHLFNKVTINFNTMTFLAE